LDPALFETALKVASILPVLCGRTHTVTERETPAPIVPTGWFTAIPRPETRRRTLSAVTLPLLVIFTTYLADFLRRILPGPLTVTLPILAL
jgi:hypothetical protein